jgi:hypothetical protein
VTIDCTSESQDKRFGPIHLLIHQLSIWYYNKICIARIIDILMYDSSLSRCKSSQSVDNLDEELDTKRQLKILDAKPVVCGAASSNANILSKYQNIVPKQAAPEMRNTKPRCSMPKKAARGNKRAAGDKKRRVGCPFFKMNPGSYANRMACRGISFKEMGKLK